MKDKFIMQKKLGGGAFGTVYLVKRTEDQLLLAAKHQKLRCEQDLRCVRREVDILDMLGDTDNPDCRDNVILMLDYYESPRECVILTEYLNGGELFERISSRNYDLTERKCKGFMRQVLLGLRYIHDKGVIHLDLKPNNIVCVSRADEDARIKIIDFGLARMTGGRDRIPITMCGTPEFISPEVMKCVSAGSGSDMWSIGVIVFMMVTGGYSPFYSSNRYKMQRNALRGNYDIEQFTNVTREAKDVIRKLLVVNYDDRLSADQCLQHP